MLNCFRKYFKDLFSSERRVRLTENSARLHDLADKWTQGCNIKEELKDLIVLE